MNSCVKQVSMLAIIGICIAFSASNCCAWTINVNCSPNPLSKTTWYTYYQVNYPNGDGNWGGYSTPQSGSDSFSGGSYMLGACANGETVIIYKNYVQYASYYFTKGIYYAPINITIADPAPTPTPTPELRNIELVGNLTFGNVTVNSTKTATLRICNTGHNAMTVSGITYPPGYIGNWSSGTIAGGTWGSFHDVTVTFSPTSLQDYRGTVTVASNKTSGNNTASISGCGIASPTPTPTQLESFRSTYQLNPNGSQYLLTPAGDGVPNLLKFAFNMIGSGSGQAEKLDTPNSSKLTSDGIAGLPLLGVDNSSSKLTLTYLRRTSLSFPGIYYTVEFSDTLDSGSWAKNPFATENTVPLSGVYSTLERVTVIDSVSLASKRFARVNVSTAPSGMVSIDGGILPISSGLGIVAVAPFSISKCETTWGEWKTVRAWASSNGYDIGTSGGGSAETHPVQTVNWYDCAKWCNARSEMEGLIPVYTVGGVIYRSGETVPDVNASANGYRLPTEAEWEWAARGGTLTQGYTYSGSNTCGDVAWSYETSSGAVDNMWSARGTWPVGQKNANELGLFDMSGNVWEWCWDSYNTDRRSRGGSWDYGTANCAVSLRFNFSPVHRANNIGFRSARSSGMVTVLGGTLPVSSPLGAVAVPSFSIGKYETTWWDWKSVRTWATENGYDIGIVGAGIADTQPVQMVNWYDVLKWCNAKSEMEGLTPVYTTSGLIYRIGESVPDVNLGANGYRLPTEAEWEWAARGGILSRGYTYSGSNTVGDVAWYLSNSDGGPKAIGSKASNELGIYDMSGNLWEWCWDAFYGGLVRAVRGGAYDVQAPWCAVDFRSGNGAPGERLNIRTFRPVRSSGMVTVQGGTLPSSSELGAVSVSSFSIGKYETTWGEWKTVRTWSAANGYDIGNTGAGSADNHPVQQVSWYDVLKWCNSRSEKEGLTPVYTVGGVIYRTGEFGPDGSTAVSKNASANGYRLPTEAEWEWAARGGTLTHGYTNSGSNTIGDVAWYLDNSSGAAVDMYMGRGTWPVGQKAANELGLYDMNGNVWEWCWDVYSSQLSWRRVRGGAWDYSFDFCNVVFRNASFTADLRNYSFGFRLARSSGN